MVRYALAIAAIMLGGCMQHSPDDSATLPQAASDQAPEAMEETRTTERDGLEERDVDSRLPPTGADAVGSEGDATPSPAPPQESGQLMLTGLDPISGDSLGGEQVVLMGDGFRPDMIVLFGDLPVTDIFILNNGAALVTTPAHPPGLIDVSVAHYDVDDGEPRVLESAFLVTADVTLTHVSPASGPATGGVSVRVSGGGIPAGAVAYIGGRPLLAQTQQSDGSIDGLTPSDTPGLKDVTVRWDGGTSALEGAYRAWAAPSLEGLDPMWGAAGMEHSVLLTGSGLTTAASLIVGGQAATIVSVSVEGDELLATFPAGEPHTLVDVLYLSEFGDAELEASWYYGLAEVDPFLLSCSHAFPHMVSSNGGELITVACLGLQYGATVVVDNVEVTPEVIDSAAGTLTFIAPSGPSGVVDIIITTPFGSFTLPDELTYKAPQLTKVDSLSPDEGATSGGTTVTIVGSGLSDVTEVRFGSFTTTNLTVIDDSELQVTAPPGVPGSVDVSLLASGQVLTIEDAFAYTDGALRLDVVTPYEVAIPGGTLLQLVGDRLDEVEGVEIGGAPATVSWTESPGQLWVRSPTLEVGVHDAVVSTASEHATLEAAVLAYDPRSGYTGAWGDPITGSVHVTVRGTQGYGPIPGALVTVREQGSGEAYSAITNSLGQVTLSEFGLTGPVDVTASAPNWTSYSLIDVDARHVTLHLISLTPSSGTGVSLPPIEEATLRGRVLGLDKYALAPPGDCNAALDVSAGLDCMPCEDSTQCGSLDCLPIVEQGRRCLRVCEMDSDCLEGYVCAGFSGDIPRCMPFPGDRIAKCAISASSLFSQNLYAPQSGWVSEGETFELQSQRLGDLAIVCFGGYLASDGDFTPTVLGVRRHVFALAGAQQDNLDVMLEHPLSHVARLDLMDSPTWPEGVLSPAITLSLDLGSDGYIPLTRPPAHEGDDIWGIARQPERLTGNLYDARYTIYTTVRAATPSGYPVAYAFERDRPAVSESRFPRRDASGAWTLDGSINDADLLALHVNDNGMVISAGANGTVLFDIGTGWTQQGLNEHRVLRAITSDATNQLWVAGDDGALQSFDGVSWSTLAAPDDSFRDVEVDAFGALWLAGGTRLWREAGGGSWSAEGPGSLQDVRGIATHMDGGLIAVGGGGLVHARDAAGEWSVMTGPDSRALNDVCLMDDGITFFAVGEQGLVLEGDRLAGTLSPIVLDVYEPLTAIDCRANGRILAVGDAGRLVERVEGQWVTSETPGYRSRLEGVILGSDGRARVVGSTAYSIGPFLSYPSDIALTPDTATTRQLSWSATPGRQASYTKLGLSNQYGPTFWTLIVDGDQFHAVTPSLTSLPDLAGLSPGAYDAEVTRVLNPNFEMDDFMSRDFSIYKRTSWSINRADITAE